MSLYFIISLAAVSVMAYVRSISVAEDNKGLFESLTKLGADHRYKRNVLKNRSHALYSILASLDVFSPLSLLL